MRLLITVAVAAAAALSAGPVEAARPCSGGTTVASTDRYRIYVDDGIYLACLRRVGNPTELYDYDSDCMGGFGQFKVAGRFIAVIGDSCASSGSDSWIVLADMRTGQTDDTRLEYYASGLALRATGSLAYSVAGSEGTGPSIELVRYGKRGKRTLSSDPGIEPGSMRRRGGRVQWVEAGRMRSARLP